MATTAVNPDPTVTRTIIEPDLSKPKVGQPTLVAFFGGDHTVRLSLGHVLAIGPVDAATGQPTLTIAYPDVASDGTVDERKLGTVRWADAYARVTGVPHFSHPDVKAGRVAVAWGGDGAIEIENAPSIPQPEGAGSDANPVFERHELQDPAPGSGVNEAIVAQHSKAPEGTHQSPATSEAGTVHDAVVEPSRSATGETLVDSTDSTQQSAPAMGAETASSS